MFFQGEMSRQWLKLENRWMNQIAFTEALLKQEKNRVWMWNEKNKITSKDRIVAKEENQFIQGNVRKIAKLKQLKK
jgi:hypothetical protein